MRLDSLVGLVGFVRVRVVYVAVSGLLLAAAQAVAQSSAEKAPAQTASNAVLEELVVIGSRRRDRHTAALRYRQDPRPAVRHPPALPPALYAVAVGFSAGAALRTKLV